MLDDAAVPARCSAGRHDALMAPRLHVSTHELPFTPPLFPDNLFGHLAATGVPGVEEWAGGAYRRTVRFAGGGHGILSLRPPVGGSGRAPERERHAGRGTRGTVVARLWLTDPADEAAALAMARRLLDLDADPHAIDQLLGGDDALAPLIRAAPGRRVPGAADGGEMAIRAVLGQQVSTAAARTHAGRLVLATGDAIDDPEGGLTHLFPLPEAIANAREEVFAFPAARQRSLRTLAEALAGGQLPGLTRPTAAPEGVADGAAVRAALAELPGLGPWTIETIAMRALGDRDAFIPTDLGIRGAAQALGLPSTPAALIARAEAWRPYRAYAVQHLWATGTHAVNVMPTG